MGGPTFQFSLNCLLQAAPRASMANTVVRNAIVLTGAGATASMGPASVTQGSMAVSATLVSSTTSVYMNGDACFVLSHTAGNTVVASVEALTCSYVSAGDLYHCCVGL